MDTTPSTSVPEVFAAAVRRYPSRPLLTCYDDATGERTELSGATLENWVAKTANLLVDGYGLGIGDRAALRLPPHWQSAAVLLGCWAAGLTVDLEGAGAPVAFLAADRLDEAGAIGAGETFGLALAPLAAPLAGRPEGVLDYVLEVRGYGDRFVPLAPVGPLTPALAGNPPRAHTDVVRTAADRAGAAGLTVGARVLVDADVRPDPVEWLLAPLVAGAASVLCRHLDPARLAARLATERATMWS
ncbi:MAG: TIGR03089 family protein [Micromonosporaceae bacterium]